MEGNSIDKITRDLLKKGLSKPENPDFNDELMKKISTLPKPAVVKPNNRLLKNGWGFLILALALLLISVTTTSYLANGYEIEISKAFIATKMFILYGGMALFVPLLFTQLDDLLKMVFENQVKLKADN